MLTHKKWLFTPQDTELINHISQKFNISIITASVIINRGFVTDEEIENYINIPDSQFYDPFLLKNMTKAVNIIKNAINKNDKIAVYGDYDVDGITATYILYDYLKTQNANVVYYIPDRIEEGYGLNTKAIDKLNEDNVNLIITVDVGITALTEVEYAKSKNISTIITDHHTPLEDLPDALAIINPKIPECSYPNKELAGVGVSYKLVCALSNCDKNIINKYIEAACIGTIADMVPLTGENRLIASKGLEALKTTQNTGLNFLMKISGINKEEITASNISFGIAPRLNAAGRIASATSSVRLFLTQSDSEAAEIASYLDTGNKTRQNEESKIVEQAINIIEKDKLFQDNVIVVAGENWHHGIIGIVSSKITEKYYKPSCIISMSEYGTAKASGRSITGFNLFNALSYSSDTLTKFGGHELAAGFSLKNENIDIFRKTINEYAQKVMTADVLTPKIIIDAKISLSDMTSSLFNELKLLEPHGTGNRTPIFEVDNVSVNSVKLSKTGKHSFLNITDSKSYVVSPAFNMPEITNEISCGDKVKVAGTINLNNFHGTENVQLLIKDIQTSDKSSYSIENMRCVFVCIKELMSADARSINTYELSSILRTKYNLSLNKQRISNIISVFNELKITECVFSNDNILLEPGSNYNSKCRIEDSVLYNKLLERMN